MKLIKDHFYHGNNINNNIYIVQQSFFQLLISNTKNPKTLKYMCLFIYCFSLLVTKQRLLKKKKGISSISISMNTWIPTRYCCDFSWFCSAAEITWQNIMIPYVYIQEDTKNAGFREWTEINSDKRYLI